MERKDNISMERCEKELATVTLIGMRRNDAECTTLISTRSQQVGRPNPSRLRGLLLSPIAPHAQAQPYTSCLYHHPHQTRSSASFAIVTMSLPGT